MEGTQLSPPAPPKGRSRNGPTVADERRRNGDVTPAPEAAAPQHHESNEADWGEIHRPKVGSITIVGMVAAVLVLALVLIGLVPRIHQTHELNADAVDALNAPVMVNIAQPQRAPESTTITVPGTLRPWQEVSVFSRTTGYLKHWYADISNQVKQGELLAEIDAPEVDAQLAQAQASLQQMQGALAKAESDLQIAKLTNERYQAIRSTVGVTQQDLDQKQSDSNAALANREAARANVAAAQSNVKRLSDLKAYEKLYAPFAGVITSRPYDTGSLINADPTDVNVRPIYKIAENDVLRAFVNIPQSSALSIQKGMEANVAARERPGHVYVGKVMGTTNYLDQNDRTLLTEIKVPNDDRSLLPGMYVQVTFTMNRIQPPLLVPGPSIVQTSEGSRVAVVIDGKVHFQKVRLGRDFGNDVEIVEGLKGDEQVIANPGERIAQGVRVKAGNDASSQPATASTGSKVAEAGK